MLRARINVSVQLVDLSTEARPQAQIEEEVIHKVIEDPMSKSGEGADSNDPPVVF
jgi:hypothetical protein